jgi:hypothetical protein
MKTRRKLRGIRTRHDGDGGGVMTEGRTCVCALFGQADTLVRPYMRE